MAISKDRWRGRLDGIIRLLYSKGIVMSDDTYRDVFQRVQETVLLDDSSKADFNIVFFKALAKDDNNNENPAEQQLGQWEVNYVCTNYSESVIHHLAQEVDYVAIYQEQAELQRQEDKRRMKKRLKIWVPIIVAAIVAIIIYNLPYFAEKRAYDRIKENPEITEIDDYISKYDNPEHLPEVLYLKAEYELQYSSYDIHAGILALEEINKRFPNSIYAKKATQKVDSLWDNEISMFTTLNPDYEKSESLKSMYEMLLYMKANRIYDIKLNIIPKINLKEYNEYPQTARDFLKTFYPDIENDIPSINNYFTTEDQKELYSYLETEVHNAFDSVFKNGFFKVTTEETDNNKLPQINLVYYISTQEFTVDGILFPDVWTSKKSYIGIPNYGYTSNSNSYEDIILGISIKFEASLKYPGQTNPWSVTITGAPEETISNISTISDAYDKMTKVCFEKFGEGLIKDLGLESADEEAAVSIDDLDL